MDYKVGYKKPIPQWKPGQSGNPKGRPKNSLTSLLQRALDADNEAEKQGIINELIKLAKMTGGRGQSNALKEIFERIDGKVADKHLIQGMIVHVGDEYALKGLEANRLDMERRLIGQEGADETQGTALQGEE